MNFSIRFAELTKTRVSKQPTGDPNHLVMPLTDDYLFQCPVPPSSRTSARRVQRAEVEALREYLLKGGFIWVDDFWGPWALASWEEQIGRVLPPAEYPIRDITPDHPIFRTMFQVAEVAADPVDQSWRRSGGGTSERGADSAEPHIRGISDAHGHLMVLMTHNTDISDAWEREGEDPRYFYSFSPDGYAVGHQRRALRADALT